MLTVKHGCSLNGAYPGCETAVWGLVAESSRQSLHDVCQTQVCMVEGQLALCAVERCEYAEQHLPEVMHITEGRFADWLGDIMPHNALQ